MSGDESRTIQLDNNGRRCVVAAVVRRHIGIWTGGRIFLMIARTICHRNVHTRTKESDCECFSNLFRVRACVRVIGKHGHAWGSVQDHMPKSKCEYLPSLHSRLRSQFQMRCDVDKQHSTFVLCEWTMMLEWENNCAARTVF